MMEARCTAEVRADWNHPSAYFHCLSYNWGKGTSHVEGEGAVQGGSDESSAAGETDSERVA